MQSIQKGTFVVRLAADYTGGRTGQVLALDMVKERAHVRWTKDGRGKPMHHVKTWVKFKSLRIQDDPPILDQMNNTIDVLTREIISIADKHETTKVDDIEDDTDRRRAKELQTVIDTIKGYIERNTKYPHAIAAAWKNYAPQGHETKFV